MLDESDLTKSEDYIKELEEELTYRRDSMKAAEEWIISLQFRLGKAQMRVYELEQLLGLNTPGGVVDSGGLHD